MNHMAKQTYKKILPAITGLMVAFSLFFVQAESAAAMTPQDCTKQGGSCNLVSDDCEMNQDKLGTCVKTVNAACCKNKQAQKAVGPALQPLIEDTCKKNPNDPTCLARAASATQASAGVSAGSPMTLANPLCPTGKADCVTLNALIGRFVAAFIGMVGALALIVFIYAGIMYMTAGSSDRVKQATDTMKYAIIGLALIMFAYVLVNFFFKALTSDAPKPPPETTGYAVPQGS